MVKVVEQRTCCAKVVGSTTVSWERGQKYYIRALVKEGQGNDYLKVGFVVNGKETYPIPASMFAPPDAGETATIYW